MVSQLFYNPDTDRSEWRPNKRQLDILQKAEKKNDIWYIKTENGGVTHLAMNDITFCQHGARLISSWSKPSTPFIGEGCYVCFRNAVGDITDDNYSRYWYNSRKRYDVWWKCSAIVNSKGKKKVKTKERRCTNNTHSAYDSLCTQHEKCYYRYIQKHISVCDDVSSMIMNYL